MRLAYFDCFAGASGDMILGSLVDAGLSFTALDTALREALPGPLGFALECGRERRSSLSGTRVHVSLLAEGPAHQRRTLADILAILDEAALSPAVRERTVTAFRRLAAVEAGIHAIPEEQVHFHEIGAVDAIVDVTGAFLGLELLGVEGVHCSPLPAGGGTTGSSHGVLPLPAPATLALLAEAKAPICVPPPGARGELVTPTAAAILSTIARFTQPAMRLESVGYGAGARDNPQLPNLLRVWIGESLEAAEPARDPSLPAPQVQLLETNIDDMNPELYGYVVERLFQCGALDVWCTPIQMKKGRPAITLSVLARPAIAPEIAALLLRETSTLGVRVHTLHRWEAERAVVQFDSSLGPVKVKVRREQGRANHVAPEYESCIALARQTGLPLLDVYRQVQTEAWEHLAGARA